MRTVFLAVGLGIGVLMGATVQGSAAPGETTTGPLGDATCDGAITPADALAILQTISGLPVIVSQRWPGCGVGLTWTGTVTDSNYGGYPTPVLMR